MFDKHASKASQCSSEYRVVYDQMIALNGNFICRILYFPSTLWIIRSPGVIYFIYQAYLGINCEPLFKKSLLRDQGLFYKLKDEK